MIHRQRYLAAINREPTDRPPLDLMGTACGLTDGALKKLKSLLGITSADRLFRQGANVKAINEDVLVALNVDARRVWLRQLPEEAVAAEGGRFTDLWGIGHARRGAHVQQVDWPLADASMSDIERYAWPDLTDPRQVDGLRDEARRLHMAGEYAVVGRSPTAGFFEIGCALRGMQQYMMDMVEQPAVVEALNEHIVRKQMDLYGLYLDACGEYLDVIETGDDYGSAMGLLISPACFRRLLKPYRERLNALIKSKAPHVKIFLHSCGNVRPIIPDLIETGVDVLNPVQPVPGMEPRELVREFGRDVCFHGGVDTIGLLRQPAKQVAEGVAELRDAFRGGSWIAAPANHVQDDIPPENIRALYEVIAGRLHERPTRNSQEGA